MIKYEYKSYRCTAVLFKIQRRDCTLSTGGETVRPGNIKGANLERSRSERENKMTILRLINF